MTHHEQTRHAPPKRATTRPRQAKPARPTKQARATAKLLAMVPPVKQKIVERERARIEYLGGSSVPKCIRLERLGVLRPIKLTNARSAKVYYAIDELEALISGKQGSDAAS
jgi:hypothetical protein